MNVRKTIAIATLVSLFVMHFSSLLHASGGPRTRWGFVATKGVVVSADGNPYWVEYNEDGNVVAMIGQVKDDLANSWLMQGHEYRLHMAGFSELEAKHRGHRQILLRHEYMAHSFYDAAGNILQKPSLRPSTISVMVRSADVLYDSKDLVLYESPIDLKKAQNIDDDIRVLLLNEEGVVIYSSKVNIGHRVAFFSAKDYDPSSDGEVDMSSEGNMNLYGFETSNDNLWAPVTGVTVESTLSRRGGVTGQDGKYSFSYHLPPCPGGGRFL